MRLSGIARVRNLRGLVAVPLVLSACALSVRAEDLQLARDGGTEYRIVLSPTASVGEREAARELAEHLKEMTGASFPILAGYVTPYTFGGDEAIEAATEILVGRSPRLEALGLGIDWGSLGDEGYLIKTIERRLVIAGGPRGGTLHGVYDFLEKHLDCRWFTPQVTVIPDRRNLSIGEIDERYVPPFRLRRIPSSDSFRAPWALRNHLNFWYGHKYVDLFELLADGRSAHGYLNPNVAMASFWPYGLFDPPHFKPFLKAHPECYAMIDGKREPRSAYCWGNPKLLAFTLEQIDRWLRLAPNANVIPLGHGDFRLRVCECDLCRKLVERHAAPGAAAAREFNDFANVSLAFINEVCQGLAQRHPAVLPLTFAYNETLYPPSRVRPHKNLWIVFADIGASATQPLDVGHNLFRGVDQLLVDWGRLTDDKVLYYDYAMSPPYQKNVFYPYPMLFQVGERYRTLRRLGVAGTCPSSGAAGDGPRQHLQSYILAHVLWNPDYDVKAGIREFCDVYYGRAGVLLCEYNMDLLSVASYETPATGQWFLQRSAGPNASYGDFLRFKPQMRAKWDALLDRAEKAVADDPELLERVRIERLAFQLVVCYAAKPDDPLLAKAIEGFFPVARAFVERADKDPRMRTFLMRGFDARINWLRPHEPDVPEKPRVLKTLDEFEDAMRAFAAKAPWPDPPAPDPGEPGAPRDLPTITNSIGMKLIKIPGGTFLMGSGAGLKDETPVHKVRLGSFLMGATETTQEQYRKIMKNGPSHFRNPRSPVENVSLADAQKFCRTLSIQPAEKKAGRVYTVPTEAQWEYACRAGSTSAWSWGSDGEKAADSAWCAANSEGKTHPVATRAPNPWGLYDVHGNVWEWVATGYGPYGAQAVTDPPASGGRVLTARGGAYNETSFYLRSAIRGRAFIHYKPVRVIGFRVACRVSNEEPE